MNPIDNDDPAFDPETHLKLDESLQNLSTTEWNTIYQRTHKHVDKANAELVAKAFKPIKKMYVDLTLLKDTRMGVLLGLADKTRYQYLLGGLERYNKRIKRNFKYVYPEFPYSEAQLTHYWKDPKYSYDIFNRSPDTDLGLSFTRLIVDLYKRNNRCDYNEPIKIVINTYPLAVISLMSGYREILNMYVPKECMKVEFISRDPTTIGTSEWRTFDYLWLDDIDRLMRSDGFPRTLMLDDWAETQVYAAPTVSKESYVEWSKKGVNWEDNTTQKDLLAVTVQLLRIFCNFQFVRVSIPVPKEAQHDGIIQTLSTPSTQKK